MGLLDLPWQLGMASVRLRQPDLLAPPRAPRGCPAVGQAGLRHGEG